MTLKIQNKYLREFLALQKVRTLWNAFQEASAEIILPTPIPYITLALIVGCIPIIGVVMQSNGVGFDAPIVFSGVALLGGLLLRSMNGINYQSVVSWKDSFSKTHTAFGLSCIPLALILVFYQDAFYSIDLGLDESEAAGETIVSYSQLVYFILFTSLWAGLTEEIIYRGTVLAFFRRIPLNISQAAKDWIAILISAFMFAASHYVAWGAWLCVAVFCLGVGLGVAYVAIRERLLPIILYHAAFDVLSLSFAFLTYRL